MHKRNWLLYCCVAILVSFPSPLHAQRRMNDKDVEATMEKLRDDAKDFRPKFESALKKSTIRKTSQEKDAKSLISSFEKQTDAMFKEFKKSKKGDVAVETTLSNAEQIDKLIYSLQAGPQIDSQWARIRAELDRVSSAFGIMTRSSGSRMQ